MSESMALVRQWLAKEPSEEVWQTLCDLLDKWPQEENPSMAEEYIRAHLDSSWSDRFRIPYTGWAEDFVGWKCSYDRVLCCQYIFKIPKFHLFISIP